MAQRGVKHRSPVYSPGTAFKHSGWFVGGGITYMLPEHRRQTLTAYYNDQQIGDTLFEGDYKRSGKIGAYLEFGRHHFVTNRFLLDHWDYGIHGKLLRGKEVFSGFTGNSPVPIESNSRFGDLFLGGFINASHIFTLKDKHYLMNSLGLNLDYRLLGRRSAGTEYGANYQFPSAFTGQLHYKLSYIWRPESGIYVVPSIETPLLTAYPWDGPKATLHYFTDRSRPFLISLRIQWLSKEEARKCEGQPGQSPSLDDGNRHGKNDLFGADTKSMKKARKKTSKRQERAQKSAKRKKSKSAKKS
jgi:hypothetical protein